MMTKTKIFATFFLFIVIRVYPQESSYYIYSDNHISTDLAISPNNQVLIFSDGAQLFAYSLAEKMVIGSFGEGHTDNILSLAFSSDSSIIVSGGRDCTIAIWGLTTRNLRQKMNYHSAPILSLALSSDSRYLCSGDSDGNIFLWDFVLNDLTLIDNNTRGEVTSIVFGINNKTIIWGTSSGNISCYLVDEKVRFSFPGAHSKWVRSISVSDDGLTLYSGGDDKCLIVWDISSIKNIKQVSKKKFLTWVTSVDGNYNPNFYAVGTLNGRIHIKIPIGSVYTCFENGPIRSLKILTNSVNSVYLIASIHGRGVKFIPLYSMSISK